MFKTPRAKLILGLVLTAALNALVMALQLPEEYQVVALGLVPTVIAWLGLPRPGDVTPAQVAKATEAAPVGPPVAHVDPVTKSVKLV